MFPAQHGGPHVPTYTVISSEVSHTFFWRLNSNSVSSRLSLNICQPAGGFSSLSPKSLVTFPGRLIFSMEDWAKHQLVNVWPVLLPQGNVSLTFASPPVLAQQPTQNQGCWLIILPPGVYLAVWGDD